MLKLEDISVSVPGDNGPFEIIENVSLTLDEKKIYVMTGPNGGGKSSLAKAIMGIYPLTGGKILLDDEDITELSITERAKRGIGYAFQSPTRFKGITVGDFLQLASGGEKGQNSCDSCELLINVGLCAQDYLGRELNASLSGGELKRVEIASILARDLKVALFDEPEAGIDLWSFQKLTETFRELNKRLNTTIIIISHQERILRLADEVIMVANGKVSEITSRDKILEEIGVLDSSYVCPIDCSATGGKPC